MFTVISMSAYRRKRIVAFSYAFAAEGELNDRLPFGL
jgi:hypothetical protein